MICDRQSFSRYMLLVMSALALTIASVPRSFATPINSGDVFLSLTQGKVQHYDSNLVLLETLTTHGGLINSRELTGMAFDCFGNLYVTIFSDGSVSRFRQSDGARLEPVFVSSPSTLVPESIVFDASNSAYIGNVAGNSGSGNFGLGKYDSNGALIASFLPGTRLDWMDLSADQKTMLFTQEGQGGTNIKQLDLSTGNVLMDLVLNSGLYSVRILPNGDVLASDRTDIKRFNAMGLLQQTYSIPGYQDFFDIYLGLNGDSFWAIDIVTQDLLNIDVTSGLVLDSVNANQPTLGVRGVAVAGGFVAAKAVPEPSTVLLAAFGMFGLCIIRIGQRTSPR